MPPDNLIGVLLQSGAYTGPAAPTPGCAVNADRDRDGLSDAEEAARGTNPDHPDTDGDGLKDGAEVFQYGTKPLVVDTDGDGYGDGTEIQAGTNPLDPASVPGGGTLPPDPGAVAPPINSTVATTTFAATEFLYTGGKPIQTGVAPGTIDPKRAAVLRGRVLDKNNAPLPGVTLTILNHPEFGQTLSRADGMFDMAVNGGGVLTLNYQRAGYLPTQRQVNAPWQDFVVVADVVLMALDPQVTTVEANAPTAQVARGTVMTDASGSRQATLLFPAGTTATMTLPNGATQPLGALQVRATEYTVGTNGPQAMPAMLPPTSGYTYAVELSVDEALNAGAKTVQFNQPIPFYVDNFLNFPVGIQVPLAYYDREKAAWVPTDDGRVIKVLSIVGGVAQVDTTGNGTADNGAAIGMTEAERQRIASLYPAGKTLQRAVVKHLTPYDLNYGFVAQTGAVTPQPEKTTGGDGKNLDSSGGNSGSSSAGTQASTTTCFPSSIIECENQTLGEFIPVVGTGLNLNYRSDRVPGRKAANTVTIPLSGATVPSVLKRIELEIMVAGRTSKQTFPARRTRPIPSTGTAWMPMVGLYKARSRSESASAMSMTVTMPCRPAWREALARPAANAFRGIFPPGRK